MKDMAEESGLVNMRRQPLTPNCRPALEVSAFARDKGQFDQYHKATFKAFWEESKNIGDAEILGEILRDCGLDWEEFNLPENRLRYAQRVELQLAEAQMYGITGVPAYIIDRYLVVGAQPYQVFQAVMARIQQEKTLQGLWLPGRSLNK